MSWPGDLVPLSAPVGVVDQCPQDADVGAGEDAFSVQVGHPFLVAFDQGALEPLVDQHLVARGGALWFGEFDLHSALADRGGELELFHPGKVGQGVRKVKGRKGEFLGSVWGFVGRVWGVGCYVLVEARALPLLPRISQAGEELTCLRRRVFYLTGVISNVVLESRLSAYWDQFHLKIRCFHSCYLSLFTLFLPLQWFFGWKSGC